MEKKRFKSRQFTAALAKLLTAAVGVAFLAACDDDAKSSPNGAGFIVPALTVDATVVVAADVAETMVLPDVPSPEELRLSLTKGDTGRTAQWESVDDFDVNMLYTTGAYTMTAQYGSEYDEGFDNPYFCAETDFMVSEMQRCHVALNAKLGNTVIHVDYSSSIKDYFADFSIGFHSEGGNYLGYGINETRNLYLRPGDIWLFASMTLPDGREAVVDIASITEAKAQHFYQARLSVESSGEGSYPTLVLSFDEKTLTDDITFALSDELFDAKAPVVETCGFVSGQPLTLVEGGAPDGVVAMEVKDSQLSSFVLTTQSPGDIASWWPEEMDLLNIPKALADSISAYGLVVNKDTSGNYNFDFTKLIPRIQPPNGNGNVAFIAAPHGVNRLLGKPVELSVDVKPVDIEVVTAPTIVVGQPTAVIELAAPSADLERNLTIEASTAGSEWTRLNITGLTKLGNGNYKVEFDVPDGTDPVELRLEYCHQIKKELTVKRIAPLYNIEVDGYARSALVKIVAADEPTARLITTLATPYDDSGHRLPVTARIDDSNILLLSGLEPETVYTLRLSIFNHPTLAEYSNSVTFRTEKASQLPNPGFEEVRKTIDYKDMLCGGRYSQNLVAIFNQQNKHTWKLYTPRQWANTNAKTFCMGATNHNTWYMQPSCYTVTDSYSGGYALQLKSVGWDLDGPEIPDYLQKREPYVAYSRNVPSIAWRAAGKAFIGDYRFDPATLEETYTEGMGFDSRPTALNGFYKFVPCEELPMGCGLVVVELYGIVDGQRRLIASNSLELPFATDYTAFKVPLSYSPFGVKATEIRVMFASSSHIGTISHETTNIVTTSNLKDAASTGGTLTIDELSLSY